MSTTFVSLGAESAHLTEARGCLKIRGMRTRNAIRRDEADFEFTDRQVDEVVVNGPGRQQAF